MQRNNLFAEFVQAEEQRASLKITPLLDELLSYQQYTIRKQYDKVSSKTKFKKKKEHVSDYYTGALASLSRSELVQHYIRQVESIKQILQGKVDPFDPSAVELTKQAAEVYVRSMTLRTWKPKVLRVLRREMQIELQEGSRINKHELSNYIYRKSKSNEYFSFVLEAINSVPKAKHQKLHIGFTSIVTYNEWFEEIKKVLEFAHRKIYAIELGKSLVVVEKAENGGQSEPRVQTQSNKATLKQPIERNLTTKVVPNDAIAISKNQPKSTKKVEFVPEKVQNGQHNNNNNIVNTNSSSNGSPALKPTTANTTFAPVINPPAQQQQQQQQVVIVREEPKKPKIEEPPPQNKNNTQQNQKQQITRSKDGPPQQKQKEEIQQEQEPKIRSKKNSNIVTSIIEDEIQLGEIEHLQSQMPLTPKTPDHPHPNIFNVIMPDYDLNKLMSEDDMQTVQCQLKHRLLQSKTNPRQFKLFLTFNYPVKYIFRQISNVDNSVKWNTQIDEISTKNMISSENTAILYMRLKQYSRIYRARDFLFLRHAFKKGKNMYMVDKSIDNVNYPPFLTIVRGNLTVVYGIFPNKEETQSLLVIDIDLNNQGYLNDDQNKNLAVYYLKNYFGLQNYLMQQSNGMEGTEAESAQMTFDLEWDIGGKQDDSKTRIQEEKKERQLIETQKKMMEEAAKQKEKQKQKQIKINNNSEIAVAEKKKKVEDKQSQAIAMQPEDRGEETIIKNNTQMWANSMKLPQLDEEGRSILNYSFLKTKYKTSPWNRELLYQDDFKVHQIWNGEWDIDQEKGGMWFVDQQKMAQQKKVLSYVLSKMGKNLLSGKGILNVSLPVDIFSLESNIETHAKTFAYAPILLQKASNLKDPLEQLKFVIAFGISISLLYISMDKPFNPILGQTFQCSFNGCPVYVQQISHHPPIAALYMVGRGYKVYGSIESKMELSVNSGCGLNDGDYVVIFDNGTEFRFRTPGGEISGLTYGDRKLNFVGKSYYWEPNQGYMLDLTFNPGKKGFFSLSKQEIPTDYFEGTLKKVKKQFIFQFQNSRKNKPSPSNKDILQEYYKVHGQWNKEVFVDNKVVLNIDKDRYVKFEYEPNPLPSDCLYREDIVYRRTGNIPRSQNEKERLEVLQRQDRKLRDKPRKK